jgi:Xaa-Pro aminopeptidase
VGLDIHEAPSISANDARLRVGHVVTVEPGLYYPEHGGVRIEDTVVVTRRGFDFLATCPKEFEV